MTGTDGRVLSNIPSELKKANGAINPLAIRFSLPPPHVKLVLSEVDFC